MTAALIASKCMFSKNVENQQKPVIPFFLNLTYVSRDPFHMSILVFDYLKTVLTIKLETT